jgi:hypothetical protein
MSLLEAIIAQPRSRTDIYASVTYSREFLVDGYVQVREWDMEGDKLDFKSLGIDNYSSIEIRLDKNFRRNNRATLAVQHLFLTGSGAISDDIAYNGTMINGRPGLDVSKSRYDRFVFTYHEPLQHWQGFTLELHGGLLYERINFYVDGEVLASSPRSEVYENFGRQAFPYPYIGLNTIHRLSTYDVLALSVSGTHIPSFKSFFKEGGNMYLKYKAFMAEASYSRSARQWRFSLGARMRYMHLVQDSIEDTNDIQHCVIGPFVQMCVRLGAVDGHGEAGASIRGDRRAVE